MPIIEVQGLHKNYGDVQAVRGVDFFVNDGEIFGILGPNGAGKTTTLEVLEGLKKADGGQVLIDGLNVLTDKNAVKKIIGVQLQQESFFENLSLVELLELLASFYHTQIDAVALLKSVDLLDKANAYYNDMSGGQQRRFSIAAALVSQPKILFLDEPTTGLDPQSRRYFWELIKSIRQSGTTIILTTHCMEEAEVLCDRIAIMDHGKIVKIGTPQELIDNLPVNSIITFSSDKELSESDLKILYGVNSAKKQNGIYSVHTPDPTATLYRLLQDAFDKKLNLQNLNMRRPTLEDVFIYFTGHELRD